MSKRAAIYVRISRDSALLGLGVERQTKECMALAKRLGLTVVETFKDNDVSAKRDSRTGLLKRRPGYLSLLAACRAGEVDVILCWDTDRLNRDARELEDLIDALEVHGVAVHPCSSSPLDLASANGKMVARMLGSVAIHESEHKGERVKAQKAQRREQGAWTGGKRPYGYCLARNERNEPSLAIVEAEAKEVRRMVTGVANGETLSAIARDLNGRGVLTAEGKAWLGHSVRQVIVKPLVAGLRSHEGAVVGQANWPAIVDVAVWEQALTILSDPARQKCATKGRSWLCSGWVENAAGKKAKVGGPSTDAGLFYSAPGVSFPAKACDEMVWSAILAHTDTMALDEAPVDATVPEAIRELEAEQAELGRNRKAWGLSLAAFAAADRDLSERIKALRADLPRVRPMPDDVAGLLREAGAVRRADEAGALDLTKRREIVGALVERIVVHGRYYGNRTLDDRLDLVWRDQEDD